MKCNNSEGGPDLRIQRKSQNENERLLFQNWWKELIDIWGVYVDYFTYDYALSAHDFFYGEHPTAPFSGPTGMVMMAEFNNDSLMLSKFGIQTDADATYIVHIQSFRESMGSTAEPKAGDLIRMTELSFLLFWL